MHHLQAEQTFIGAALQDPGTIDQAIAEGVRRDTFTSSDYGAVWLCLMELRSKGQLTDGSSVILSMGKDAPIDAVFEAERANPTSAHGKKAMKRLLWEQQKRNIRPALSDLISQIDDDAKQDDIIKAVEGLQSHLKPSEAEAQTLDQLISDVSTWAQEEIAGTRQTGDVVFTGLPSFDRHAGGIEAHEYVILCARTSMGKSSLMSQIAAHNLQRGLRIAHFTLETSAQSVVRQIAGQRARVDLRHLRDEMPERQKRFVQELETLKKQPLRVFDRDLSISQIESRCRILAATWKPQAVFVDYMGLIRGTEGSAYERMGQLSKAMIPLRKALGCALIVGAQLNRGNEKEDRAPSRTDLRDAGSLEEDAHRIVALHRPSKDFSGQQQELGQTTYDYEILQLKLRDGPLAHARIKYNAPHTKFYEEACG